MSQIKVFTVTVSILFITPTTVYAVAEITVWHENPAHEMPVPTTHETRSHVTPAVVSSTWSSLWYSPEISPIASVGTSESRRASSWRCSCLSYFSRCASRSRNSHSVPGLTATRPHETRQSSQVDLNKLPVLHHEGPRVAQPRR